MIKMDTDYSIDSFKEQIFYSKTSDYFEEVVKTYYTSCYRSSIVMLYSVVICDLIFKLEDLRDIYGENSAKKILLEIEKIQKENPKSPDWENKLIEMISNRTTLLEISDIENINQLQKHRHLSAHPVLNQTSILFKPNKETVKSHIRNILEGVLIKPPILSKKIFNDLIKDIAENKYRLTNQTDLKRFLNSKYFKNLRQETINDIFKKLWKFVYKLDNNECNENRRINFLTLRVIVEKNQNEIIKIIKNEEKHYEGVLRGEPTGYLFDLLYEFPKLYNSLSDDTKSFINYELNSNLELRFLSWFIEQDFNEFIKNLIQDLETKDNFNIDYYIFEKVENIANDFNLDNKVLDLAVIIFGKSDYFNVADKNFNHYIMPNLENFSKNQYLKILGYINDNFQLYARNGSSYDNSLIKKACDKKYSINYSNFHNFHY